MIELYLSKFFKKSQVEINNNEIEDNLLIHELHLKYHSKYIDKIYKISEDVTCLPQTNGIVYTYNPKTHEFILSTYNVNNNKFYNTLTHSDMNVNGYYWFYLETLDGSLVTINSVDIVTGVMSGFIHRYNVNPDQDSNEYLWDIHTGKCINRPSNTSNTLKLIK
jgi:hypothetical protein